VTDGPLIDDGLSDDGLTDDATTGAATLFCAGLEFSAFNSRKSSVTACSRFSGGLVK
jgi:hypothetical protein